MQVYCRETTMFERSGIPVTIFVIMVEKLIA